MKQIINLMLIFIISLVTCYIYITYSAYLNVLMKVCILILYLLFVFTLYSQRNDLLFIIYFVFLFVVLFVRDKVDTNVNEKDYLNAWLKLIFKNKIVFINVVGNILLYVPMAMYIYKFIYNKKLLGLNSVIVIIVCFMIVLLLELIQMISFRGVFDYIDIILNMIGVILVVIIYEFIEGIRYERTKEK